MKKNQGAGRAGARVSAGTRASDYATSKYWQDPDHPEARPTDAPGHPAAEAPVPAPAIARPLAAGSSLAGTTRVPRRSPRAVSVALAFALLAGAGGGAYWYLNRDDTSTAAAGGTATPSSAASGGSGSTAPAADVVAKKSSLPDLSSLRAQRGGYLFRSKHNRIAIRMPHRPTTSRVAHPTAGVQRALTVFDKPAQAKMQWLTMSRTIAPADQIPGLKIIVKQVSRDLGLPIREQRVTRFHGHRTVLSVLGSKATNLTVLGTVWGADRMLIMLAPSGDEFALMAGSFTRRV